MKAGARSVLGPQKDRLDSWKEIAMYLRREVRTVRRWMKRERLPVPKLVPCARSSTRSMPGCGAVVGPRANLLRIRNVRKPRLNP